jgi:uncharacterized protein (TIGR03435 family)
VQDSTGLKGEYQFTLQWTRDDWAGVDSRADPLAGIDIESFPFLFQALQHQLGLQLNKGEGVIQLLVVDHADQLLRPD